MCGLEVEREAFAGAGGDGEGGEGGVDCVGRCAVPGVFGCEVEAVEALTGFEDPGELAGGLFEAVAELCEFAEERVHVGDVVSARRHGGVVERTDRFVGVGGLLDARHRSSSSGSTLLVVTIRDGGDGVRRMQLR